MKLYIDKKYSDDCKIKPNYYSILYGETGQTDEDGQIVSIDDTSLTDTKLYHEVKVSTNSKKIINYGEI